jgi:hypothetical protein
MLPDRGLVTANVLLRALGTDLVAIVLLGNKMRDCAWEMRSQKAMLQNMTKDLAAKPIN